MDSNCQASSLQKLFSVETEFEDEDFLLAMKDVEKKVSAPTPANSRCLRPLLSGLRAPCDTHMPAQNLSTLGLSKAMSPVLQIQNYSKLRFGEDDSHSKVESNQVTSPLVAGFKVQKDLATLPTEHKASSRFKFVKRHSVVLPTVDVPCDDELDNELFLAACLDVEESDTPFYSGPSISDCGSQEQMRGINSHDIATVKRPWVADSVMLMDPARLETSQLERTPKETSVGVTDCLQPVEASPRLTLRPTAMGSCLSQSNLRISTNIGAHLNSGCQIQKPSQASLDKPIAGSTGQCLPLVRSHSSFALGTTPPRAPTPRLHSYTTVTHSMPRMASCDAQLLSAYGPSMTSLDTPSTTPKASCSTAFAGNLQTPVVTNHLVRLVTAASKTPQPMGRMSLRAKTRRFPGPAGILPHQPDGKNLEEILISTPQTPTHGALAKVQTEEMPASQQSVEEEFGRGPWVAMKTELGLDEGDPSCFLRTYSVAMVLRKAALKRLPKSKVPKMAVIIKSLMRTNVDAGAVFKDPTGEMQGTIHRLLLEEKNREFKTGSVLLLKQVGVFSPSYRNHYLNVTPNNLVKIYPPGLDGGKPPQLCHDIREIMEMVAPQMTSTNFLENCPMTFSLARMCKVAHDSIQVLEMREPCCGRAEDMFLNPLGPFVL